MRVKTGKDLVEIDPKTIIKASANDNNQSKAVVAYLNSKDLRGRGAPFSYVNDVPYVHACGWIIDEQMHYFLTSTRTLPQDVPADIRGTAR